MKGKNILYPFVDIVYKISGKFRRNNKTWIFGAWRGLQYSDNTKYMFEYMVKNYPEFHCVWLTNKKEIARLVRSKGYEAYSKYSLKTIYYVITAKFIFETEGMHDIPFHFLSNGAIIIQLWHGVALKSCSKWIESGVYKNGLKPWNNHYDQWIWMAASDLYINTYSNYIFGHIPNKQFYLTGLPRNDSFIKKEKNDFIYSFEKNHPNGKLICYMPTHRGFGEFPSGMLSKEILEKINDFLVPRNIYMILKPHFHELKRISDFQISYTNIFLATNIFFNDVYSYLPWVDLLISDYSSVICDFICADKPIILFDYDIEEMCEREGGMLPIYNNFRFGPRCKTWDEVLNAVEDQLNEDKWKEKRNEDFKMIQTYNDGNNCKRVFDTIMSLYFK